MKAVNSSLWSQAAACLFSCVMLLSLWACEKQDTLVDPTTPVLEEPVTGSARAAAATYTTSPVKDVYTGCSTGNLFCGGTVSGGLRSKVVAQTGDYFKIRIERCASGQPFGALGDAFIRATSVCGTQAGKASIVSTSYYYIDVEFWATFSTGTVNFWPVIEFKNGSKLFGNPVAITAKEDIYEKKIVSGTGYRHFCQLNGNYYPGVACLPTSYMMARGIVYSNRAVSSAELTVIAKGMYTSSGGTSIVNASAFAKKDIGSCNLDISQTNTSDKVQAKTNIKNAIVASRPMVALVYPNIASSGSMAHFVAIVGVRLTSSDDTSIIYYIDPLSRSAGVLEVSLTKFLTSMKSASSMGIYNLLRVGC